MTLSLQKFLLVLLFNYLFIACIATNLQKNKKNSLKEKKEEKEVSLIEKKTTNKQVPSGPQENSYNRVGSANNEAGKNVEPRVNYKYQSVKMVKQISAAGKAALKLNKE